jgi:hypothetical protein
MYKLLLFCFALLFTAQMGCKKAVVPEELPVTPASSFTQYLIRSGQHEATTNFSKKLDVIEMKFTVKFDNSAIYKTITPVNQLDINKLYGFADNDQHHQQFSARFGWRWSDNALRLFAYVYNNGNRTSKELGTISIGTENSCAIKITPAKYLFSLNGKVDSLPRLSTTPTAVGYQLYPYFGGDETAPHDMKILIREEK